MRPCGPAATPRESDPFLRTHREEDDPNPFSEEEEGEGTRYGGGYNGGGGGYGGGGYGGGGYGGGGYGSAAAKPQPFATRRRDADAAPPPTTPTRAPLLTGTLLCFLAAAAAAIAVYETNSVHLQPASSSSSSSSAGAASALADAIDGGGWRVVRCVSSTQGTWHPATDSLYGTDVYGRVTEITDDQSDWAAADATFSVAWDPSGVSEYLFGLTDLSLWLVAAKATVYEYGSPTESEVLASSAAAAGQFRAPYRSQWYIREGSAEDPWVSVLNHSAAAAGSWDPEMVYGENGKTGHMEHLGRAQGVGACVWLR